jgi:hypothetical protein
MNLFHCFIDLVFLRPMLWHRVFVGAWVLARDRVSCACLIFVSCALFFCGGSYFSSLA